MLMTSYTDGDVRWVMRTISKNQKRGISLKQLCKLSLEYRDDHRYHMQESELPPGREKITQIVKDFDGTHWKVKKSAGGRGKTAVIRPLKLSEIVAVERIAHGIDYGNMVEKLGSFKKMGDVPFLEANMGTKKKPFKRKDFFDYAALKDDMLGFPMRIFLARGQLGRDKEDLFDAMVSDIKTHITTMKKIEEDQKHLNKKFPEMLEAVEKLRARNSGEMILKNKTPDLPNQIVPYRNAIRRLSKQL